MTPIYIYIHIYQYIYAHNDALLTYGAVKIRNYGISNEFTVLAITVIVVCNYIYVFTYVLPLQLRKLSRSTNHIGIKALRIEQ